MSPMKVPNTMYESLPRPEGGWYDLSPRGSAAPPMFLSSASLGSAGTSGVRGLAQRCRLISTLREGAGKGPRKARPPEQDEQKPAAQDEQKPAAQKPVTLEAGQGSLLVSVKQVHSMDVLIIRGLQRNGGRQRDSVRISVISSQWREASFSRGGEKVLAEPGWDAFLDEAADGFPMLHGIEADGILTNLDLITPGVTVADCMPIFLHTGAWRGLLHSGWAGTGILRAALEYLSEAGQEAPEVVLGPCISADSYEVDQSRADLFSRRHGANAVRGRHLDLPAANLGILEEISRMELFRQEFRILVRDSCTVKHSGLFSYRRMGPESYGLMLALFPPDRSRIPVCSGSELRELQHGRIRKV
ncbi:polyphenol oxidase family protein [Salinispira pacifica]|uniref:Uncharacterized protein n=1 Tax=Salinispira pacifica TaxID=1307761 RepID=V5WI30_9SPIO|nr:polyphenol oxidase family protein [Salinispira pacifica]AHC14826.1 hypothetical protein L21SP2_1429 [Salinispira pacifica]